MRIVALALAGLLIAAPALGQDLDIPEGGFVVSDDVTLLPQDVQDKRLALIAAAKRAIIAELKKIFDAPAVAADRQFRRAR